VFWEWSFFAIAVPAVIFAGISKGGFGSGAAFASASILALVVPPGQALGIMLPLLMLIDVVTLGPSAGLDQAQCAQAVRRSRICSRCRGRLHQFREPRRRAASRCLYAVARADQNRVSVEHCADILGDQYAQGGCLWVFGHFHA